MPDAGVWYFIKYKYTSTRALKYTVWKWDDMQIAKKGHKLTVIYIGEIQHIVRVYAFEIKNISFYKILLSILKYFYNNI